MKKSYLLVGAVLVGSLMASGTVFAATSSSQHNGWGRGGADRGMMMRGNAVVGKVTAINGTTLTVLQNGFRGESQNANTGATYTVDASNATVTKNNATSNLSAISVGDMVVVKGVVSGTSVTATSIRDGIGPRGQGRPPAGSFSAFQGNGQPIVGGTVTTVNGLSLTLTNTSNVTYTVDASNAKVIKQGATTTVSSIGAGDHVLVQGTVNGTSVTASTVLDQGVPANTQSNNAGAAVHHGGFFGGLFGAIGGFFQHLFGF